MRLIPIFIIFPDGRWQAIDHSNLPGESNAKKEARLFKAAQDVVGGDIEMVPSRMQGLALFVDEYANVKSVPPLVNALASLLCAHGTRMAFGLHGPVVVARVGE